MQLHYFQLNIFCLNNSACLTRRELKTAIMPKFIKSVDWLSFPVEGDIVLLTCTKLVKEKFHRRD